LHRSYCLALAFYVIVCLNSDVAARADEPAEQRPRLQDMGISIGVIPTGPANSLTDVAGVRVGHRTIVEGNSVRTGVTAVIPHSGNVFLQKVPAAIHVANGFGKFVGSTQIEELGVLESPIVLTNTLSTFAAADALVSWVLKQEGCQDVKSVNPVVGECNDAFLNDIRQQRVRTEDVVAAIQSAHDGPVKEGCVGAGTGTRCMGWKGGIGSSSRRLPASLGGYTVGVLVQTNCGGSLTIAGVPVGRELGRYYMKDQIREHEHGSCIVIVATDAPLDARRLQRLAKRAPLGLAAAGSPISHGSGDYVLAFSTAKGLRSAYQADSPTTSTKLLRDDQLSPLFQAVRDATEEAVINSLLQAVTTTGHEGRTVEAIDPDQIVEVCQRFGIVAAVDNRNRLPPVSGHLRSAVQTYGQPPLQGLLKQKVSRFEKHLDDLMKQHNVPGVSCAFIDDRQLVWSRGFGVRCAGSDHAVDPDTVMEACSMSKPFFSYLLLKLVEEGEFDLDKPLVDYLAEDYVVDDPRHRLISARMSMTHSSGLPNWRSGGWRNGSPMSLAFEPGTKFRYSGEGFLMLQRAVEKHFASGLDTLSLERLIKPLKLTNTRYVWDDRFTLRSSCGHDRDGNAKTRRKYYSDANAAYSLYTSAADYARFLVEIMSEDRSGTHSISARMSSQMLAPGIHRDDQDADWGLGWGLKSVDGRQQVYHSGSNATGFRCYSEFCPETGDGLVIMSNAIGGKELWQAVIEQWHNKPTP
jgi:D-aminopeptidase